MVQNESLYVVYRKTHLDLNLLVLFLFFKKGTNILVDLSSLYILFSMGTKMVISICDHSQTIQRDQNSYIVSIINIWKHKTKLLPDVS